MYLTGVGSTSDGEVRVYDYSAQELLVFDDVNYPVYEGHPRMQGLVYVDRHVQVPATAAALFALMPCRNSLLGDFSNHSSSPARIPA
jgi:hypothetical protein